MQGLVLVVALGWVVLLLACTLFIWGVWPSSRIAEWSMLLLPVPPVVLAVLVSLPGGWVLATGVAMSAVAALGHFVIRRGRIRLHSLTGRSLRRHRILVLGSAGLLLAVAGLIVFSLG